MRPAIGPRFVCPNRVIGPFDASVPRASRPPFAFSIGMWLESPASRKRLATVVVAVRFKFATSPHPELLLTTVSSYVILMYVVST